MSFCNGFIRPIQLAKLGGFRRGEAPAFEIKDISQSEQIQRDAWAPTSQSAAPVISRSSVRLSKEFAALFCLVVVQIVDLSILNENKKT